MSSAFFTTRGHIDYVEKLIRWLRTRTVRMPFKDVKTGKAGIHNIDLQVRPIQLWEITYPKFDEGAILTTLNFDKEIFPNTVKMKLAYATMRKFLGCEKVPEYLKHESLAMPLDLLKYVSINPIGVKEDEERLMNDSGQIHDAI